MSSCAGFINGIIHSISPSHINLVAVLVSWKRCVQSTCPFCTSTILSRIAVPPFTKWASFGIAGQTTSITLTLWHIGLWLSLKVLNSSWYSNAADHTHYSHGALQMVLFSSWICYLYVQSMAIHDKYSRSFIYINT
jgi:hypothetical protein